MPHSLESLEIRLLLEAVQQHYGFDFRDYAPAYLKRRIAARVEAERADSISMLQHHVLHDPDAAQRLVTDLAMNVTSMFRDPGLFCAFRQRIIPFLRTYPSLRIWHAGCATGEEVYSMAILLEEEGLYDRCRIYATDMAGHALENARQGILPLITMRQNTTNYMLSQGRRCFSDYYTARYDKAILHPRLGRNIIWAQHNLVTDSSFNVFNVVMCRNVLLYFNAVLRERVEELLDSSLERLGTLVLGRNESLRLSSLEKRYEVLDEAHKVYRRVA